MCKHGLMRVLIVYGSETGCSEGAVKKLAKKWSASKSANKFKICDTLSGDTAADRFGTIKDDYDMVVVSTSSFGEGDAPNGYGKFLYELQQGAKNGTKPLAGVLHAVLGYGSSEFETFQNCPRLTDKYLGECGSRRCVQRSEARSTSFWATMRRARSTPAVRQLAFRIPPPTLALTLTTP